MARPQVGTAHGKHYGEPLKHDPNFKGPIKGRSCTDIICLALFFVFILIWIGIAGYAFRYGDPKKLLAAVDSDGMRCGLDSSVINKKYLLFFDLAKCASPLVLLNGCSTPQVCVEECPSKSWTASSYLRGKQFDAFDVQQNLICKNESIKRSVTNLNILQAKIDDGSCSEWFVKSSPVHKRCIPMLEEIKSGKEWLQNIGLANAAESLPNSTTTIYKFASINEWGAQLIQDINNSWPYIIAAAVVSAVISLIVIILLRWIACVVTWLILIGTVVLLGVASYFCYRRYDYLNKNESIEVKNKMLIGKFEELYNKKELWMFLMILTAVIGVIVLLLIIFLRKRISIAITLIKEGSKAVGSITSTLFFPIVPWILQSLVIFWTIAVGVYLASIGNHVFKAHDLTDSSCVCREQYEMLKNGDVCESSLFQQLCHQPGSFPGGKQCTIGGCRYYGRETTNIAIILQLVNAFGAFWGVWFVSGVCYMIMAATFATWYWTWNKNNVPFFVLTEASGRTLRYHLGTVAFGSLIISICSFIRALIEYTEKKLKAYENIVARALFCCLKCFFWCLESFLRYISRNAYILCAVHGKNFCISAKDAFNLLMRNAIRVVVLDKVTDFLFFVGKVFVTVIVVGGAYLFVFRHPTVVEVENLWLPLVIIAISSYFVAAIFFGVYAMAVDTLFLCFLEDCERNDGSPEKPYFMSKSLMQVLGKKNKRG